jgi:hypothetical protein
MIEDDDKITVERSQVDEEIPNGQVRGIMLIAQAVRACGCSKSGARAADEMWYKLFSRRITCQNIEGGVDSTDV